MMTKLVSVEITLLEELWIYIKNTYLTPNYGDYQNINIDSDGVLSPAIIFLAIFAAVMTSAIVMIFNKRVLGRLIRRLAKRGAVGQDNAKTLEELELEKSWAIRLFINRYTLSRAVRCREEDEFYGIIPEDEPSAEPSIGLENNEKIKVPLWRRKNEKTLSQGASDTVIENSENTDITTVSAMTSDEMSADLVASHSDSEATAGDQCDAKCDAEIEDNEPVEKPPFRDAYEISLSAPKRYKRKATDHFYLRETQKHRLLIRFDKKGTNPLGLLVLAAVCILCGVGVIKALPWVLSLFDGVLGGFNTY